MQSLRGKKKNQNFKTYFRRLQSSGPFRNIQRSCCNHNYGQPSSIGSISSQGMARYVENCPNEHCSKRLGKWSCYYYGTN